jgi:hypothetical protein
LRKRSAFFRVVGAQDARYVRIVFCVAVCVRVEEFLAEVVVA